MFELTFTNCIMLSTFNIVANTIFVLNNSRAENKKKENYKIIICRLVRNNI